MTSMVAWQVTAPGRLVQTELPRPRPERDELLVHVRACGICRTDLQLAEGATVHVLTRAEPAQQPALQLGVASVGGAAAEALDDLAADRIHGVGVLEVT